MSLSNRGLAVARNTALKSSRGKYIATIDDDDEWIDPCLINKFQYFFLHLLKTILPLSAQAYEYFNHLQPFLKRK